MVLAATSCMLREWRQVVSMRLIQNYLILYSELRAWRCSFYCFRRLYLFRRLLLQVHHDISNINIHKSGTPWSLLWTLDLNFWANYLDFKGEGWSPESQDYLDVTKIKGTASLLGRSTKLLTVYCFQYHNGSWAFLRVEINIIKSRINLCIWNTENISLFSITFICELQLWFWSSFSSMN